MDGLHLQTRLTDDLSVHCRNKMYKQTNKQTNKQTKTSLRCLYDIYKINALKIENISENDLHSYEATKAVEL